MKETSEEKSLRKEERKKRNKLKHGKLAQREAIAGLCFVTPWIVGAALFLIYPLGESLWYALNNIRITPLGKIFNFVGYGNFTQILLSDASFIPNLVDYLISTVISVPIIVVFALIIAMMLNQKIKGKAFFRMVFFLPVIIVSGPILGMLTEQNAGSISAIDTQAITTAISGFLPAVLAKPIGDLFSNMVTILWYSGVQILIFLSALQKIDPAMYEAAKIDGGSGWECFWKITLPTIKPMVLLNCIYTIVFVSSNDQNSIIVLIKNSMFSGSSEKGYGYASAMAWLYSVVVLILVGLFALIFLGRGDAYERSVRKGMREAKKQQRIEERIIRRQERRARRNQKANARS